MDQRGNDCPISVDLREGWGIDPWVNRLDGSAAYPITDFKSDEIWAFSFSLDGKRLAVERGHTESDVVLLQETKP